MMGFSADMLRKSSFAGVDGVWSGKKTSRHVHALFLTKKFKELKYLLCCKMFFPKVRNKRYVRAHIAYEMYRTYEQHKKKPEWDKVLTNSLSQFPADLFMAKVFVFLTECGKLYLCTVACKGEGMSGRETEDELGTMAVFSSRTSEMKVGTGKGKSHCGPDVIRLFSSACSCKIKKSLQTLALLACKRVGVRGNYCAFALWGWSSLATQVSTYIVRAQERRNVVWLLSTRASKMLCCIYCHSLGQFLIPFSFHASGGSCSPSSNSSTVREQVKGSSGEDILLLHSFHIQCTVYFGVRMATT